jgi:hypothetical protein
MGFAERLNPTALAMSPEKSKHLTSAEDLAFGLLNKFSITIDLLRDKAA